MRIRAEKERLRRHKEVIIKSATFYYKTIVGMILQKLPKSDIVRIFADYMKNVIENGEVFSAKHLLFIVKEIQPERMSTQELKYEGFI